MKVLRILLSSGLLAGGLAVMGSTGGLAGAATVPNCAPTQLRVSLGQSEGAAGTIYYPIVFTNHGGTCAIWGVPAVQPVRGGATHSRVPVGPAARNNSIGEMPVRHVLPTGRSVSDGLGVAESANYPARDCVAKWAGAIIVRLGTFVPGTELPLKISVCTKVASVSTRLIVSGATGA